ncbi:peptidoglycan DD-metalloendopeptidase family protein [Paraburkholderia sp.]|uniref:peptidoglycan DD-metalloendopeptidase family protein n=1 Tax=Paraburkholderia sp. TaxID=1926495 RepID=UPI00239A9ABD|nr:peptidoglycan DD-metalloendopeptidase family protein [Paraburkholderia sp.]MDE1182566.1 peptidoglycan DD-metalloendopeptidase family protein [Paraburkholderia sp.]
MLRRHFDRSLKAGVAALGLAILLSGCVDLPQQDAQSGSPSPSSGNAAQGAASANAAAVQQAQDAAAQAAALNKAIPQPYRIKRGDTLGAIAERNQVSVKDLQTWNGLKPRARMKIGQTLHIASPDTERAARAAATAAAKHAAELAAAAGSGVASTPLVAKNALGENGVSGPKAANAANAANATDTASVPPAANPNAPSPTAAREVIAQTERHANHVSLAWPAQGSVVEPFQAGETRGIEIGGKAGDPVLAAADGKVMYAGTGLNEYGSLIIVQHNKDFLTAYAHNRKLLVKTGDVVRQGEQIAEMGAANSPRVAVLFELRHDGKPIDPMPYLPGKPS